VDRGSSRTLRLAAPCFAALLLAACSGSDEPPRNLLLLTVDTLRADHLSAYGYPKPTSPAIDSLAARGVLFEHAFVQRGGTWPSLTSIFTGSYPSTHGVRSNGDMLADGIATLTLPLRDAGFETLAVITNMVMGRHPGFEEVVGMRDASQSDRDEKAVTRAEAWLRERGAKPFFLWLHLMGPHDPYEPAPRFRERFDTGYRGPLTGAHLPLKQIHAQRLSLTQAEVDHVRSLYDAEIAEVDDRIRRVLELLEELDLDDTTLVAFTSDHGEELYGRYAYWFHSWSIHDSVLNVPLVLADPGFLPEGLRVDTVVESIDVAPTLLAALGVPIPESFQGRSLLPLIAGDPVPAAEGGRAFAELGPYIQSIRTGRWHYVYNPRELSSPGSRRDDTGRGGVFEIDREELYDMREDPLQQENVASRHPDVSAELRNEVLKWRGPAANPYEAQDLDPEVRDELEALGYLH